MRLLFVCVGNSCRSQMAEGIAKLHGHDADSAGTNPSKEVSKYALAILESKGFDTVQLKPKSIDLFNTKDYDLIISMGCGVNCPMIKIDYDWNLEDPVGKSYEVFQAIAEEIEKKVLAL